MRVLHIIRQYSPGVGGLENFVAHLIKHTRPLGVESTVLTLDRIFSNSEAKLPAEEVIDGTRIVRIPYVGSKRYPIAVSALKHLKGYDLIHVHAVDFFADFLAVTAPWHKTPMVLSTHGGFFHTHFAQALKKYYFNTITARTASAYERVLACSVSDQELFQNISDHVQLIENGVDVARYQAIERYPDSDLVLCLGRLTRHKRVDRLLETISRVPEAKLAVVGPDWENLEPELKAQADKLGITDRVTFYGRVEDSVLDELISRARLMVSASEYEGFGISAVEAMAAGIPALLQPIPSFKHIARGGAAATLVDFSDPDAAADAMRSILVADASTYIELATRSQAAAQAYSWPRTAEKFRYAYEEATGAVSRRIFGVRLLVDNTQGLLARIERAIKDRSPLSLNFGNAHTLNLARKDASFRACLNRSLVANDGAGVSMASRFLYGRPFPANLNGTDFVPHLFGAISRPLRIYLLGAKSGVADDAAAIIQDRWPQHKVVGSASGYFSVADEPAILSDINAAKPDLLLVAMGNPLQEQWLDRNADNIEVPVRIGVGALFDFLAGRVHRAPRLFRLLRLEWAFRLAQEPRRLWKRYLVGNAAFLLRLATRAARSLPPELVSSSELTSNMPTALIPPNRAAQPRSVKD